MAVGLVTSRMSESRFGVVYVWQILGPVGKHRTGLRARGATNEGVFFAKRSGKFICIADRTTSFVTAKL